MNTDGANRMFMKKIQVKSQTVDVKYVGNVMLVALQQD